MKLKPEDFEKIESKKLANVLRKLHAEKTLTAKDEALLEREKAKALGLEPAAGPVIGYVQTWDELAIALGVTRRAIQEWKKDPRYAPHCPRDRADGRKEVAAWSRFMVDHNLKRAAAHVSSEEDVHFSGLDRDDENEHPDVAHPPRLSGTQADWQKAVLREKAETARLDRLTLEGRLLVASELDGPLGAVFVAIQNKLTMFPERTAPQVVGFEDVHEVTAILRAEVESDLTDLHSADYLGDAAALVAAVPFDAETERLLKLVTFDGQDRTALLQLVTQLVGETLRRIGRRALARVANVTPDTAAIEAASPLEPEPPPPSAVDPSPTEAGGHTPHSKNPTPLRRPARSKAKRKRGSLREEEGGTARAECERPSRKAKVLSPGFTAEPNVTPDAGSASPVEAPLSTATEVSLEAGPPPAEIPRSPPTPALPRSPRPAAHLGSRGESKKSEGSPKKKRKALPEMAAKTRRRKA